MSITSESLPARKEKELGAKVAELKRKIAGRMEQGLYSTFEGYGMRRDLSRSIERPEAKIPIEIRPLKSEDVDLILPVEGVESASERQQITWRRHFYSKVPHSCYVAVDRRNGTPCYLQWLISSRYNPTLAKFKCFPRFKKDEALLEQAYTPPAYRGLRIMPAAMALIAERAANMGARYVLTFVDDKNVASVKGCWRAGFEPHLLHKRIQIGYGTIVHNSFKELPPDDPRRSLSF